MTSLDELRGRERDLSQEIGRRRVGEKVDVTVLRDGKRVTLPLTLADRPDDLGGTCQ